MKANYHTHTTWCDGSDSPEAIVISAISQGMAAIGFSSHAMLPGDLLDWTLTSGNIVSYGREIRSLAAKYDGQIKIFCGVEADYIPDCAIPDRAVYKAICPDYIIGSVHFVMAPDGEPVAVDKSPEDFIKGVKEHFSGSVEAFILAYYSQIRDMVSKYDFDIVGHIDLPRKFNNILACFDENATWYREEISKTADAVAVSGKIVEVNTGAIYRRWLDDAYPSSDFRAMLRERGVRFILSSDAHCADGISCAFDRFALAENFLEKL